MAERGTEFREKKTGDFSEGNRRATEEFVQGISDDHPTTADSLTAALEGRLEAKDAPWLNREGGEWDIFKTYQQTLDGCEMSSRDRAAEGIATAMTLPATRWIENMRTRATDPGDKETNGVFAAENFRAIVLEETKIIEGLLDEGRRKLAYGLSRNSEVQFGSGAAGIRAAYEGTTDVLTSRTRNVCGDSELSREHEGLLAERRELVYGEVQSRLDEMYPGLSQTTRKRELAAALYPERRDRAEDDALAEAMSEVTAGMLPQDRRMAAEEMINRMSNQHGTRTSVPRT